MEPPASRVVVVEGIYALSSKLRDLLDLRVSIKGGVHFDLVKRVLRDIDRSGQQPEAILQQISSTVYPMYKARAPKVEGVLRCNRSIFLQVTSLMTVDGLRIVSVGGGGRDLFHSPLNSARTLAFAPSSRLPTKILPHESAHAHGALGRCMDFGL